MRMGFIPSIHPEKSGGKPGFLGSMFGDIEREKSPAMYILLNHGGIFRVYHPCFCHVTGHVIIGHRKTFGKILHFFGEDGPES